MRERIGKRRKQPLILHAGNGNAMRAATLEARLEALCVVKSSFRPRVSNPRFQERCHPFDPSIRGHEVMTNAPIQRGR